MINTECLKIRGFSKRKSKKHTSLIGNHTMEERKDWIFGSTSIAKSHPRQYNLIELDGEMLRLCYFYPWLLISYKNLGWCPWHILHDNRRFTSSKFGLVFWRFYHERSIRDTSAKRLITTRNGLMSDTMYSTLSRPWSDNFLTKKKGLVVPYFWPNMLFGHIGLDIFYSLL